MSTKVRPAKLIISERKLRRIIRDELARDILIKEGFMDAIKRPFQKLAASAKKWVIEKSTELAKKVSDALASLTVPEDINSFLSSLEAQEGGASVEELTASLPFADQINDMKNAANVEIASMLSTTAEGKSFATSKLSYILAEEKYEKNIKRLSQKLNEIAVLSTWYAISKTIITTASLLVFALQGASKMAGMLGIKKLEHFLEELAEKVEHVEEWFVEKVIFPAPVQYAAYLALSVGKKVVTKSAEKTLTYKQFHSPENKEIKEKIVKGLKIALLAAVVIEALAHIGHALMEFLHNIKESAVKIAHGAETAGLEGRGIAKAASDIMRGEESIAVK